jgi:hypothetical protein
MSTASLFRSEPLAKDEFAGRLVAIRVRANDSEDWVYRQATILGFPSIGPDPWVRFTNSTGEYLVPLRTVKAITWANEEDAS